MIEEVILTHLVKNEDFVRKVLPFLKNEYFSSKTTKNMFDIIKGFIEKYNCLPVKDSLYSSLEERSNVSETEYKETKELIKKIYENTDKPNLQWLIDESEKFVKTRAVYNALMNSINIYENKNTKYDVNAIPEILRDALSVGFDTNIGHDYLLDYEKRYEHYLKKEEKFPFDLEVLDKITEGGYEKKTLNVVIARTNGGKSLFLCHLAAVALKQNKNVLYISCEMSEEKIAQRIDANLMNTAIGDLKNLPKTSYEKAFLKIKETIKSKLIVKEYPPAFSNVSHFKHLLNELKIKKTFIPDVIIIDYINLCTSSRIKMSPDSYGYIKAISEEIRGLAVEQNLPIWTATQFNRQGMNNSDPDMENTSESVGLPFTVDFMFALIATPELNKLGQILGKQLKNRYSDSTTNKKFILGIDRPKMKFYNVDNSKAGIIDDSVENEEESEIPDESDVTHNKKSDFFDKVTKKPPTNSKFNGWS